MDKTSLRKRVNGTLSQNSSISLRAYYVLFSPWKDGGMSRKPKPTSSIRPRLRSSQDEVEGQPSPFNLTRPSPFSMRNHNLSYLRLGNSYPNLSCWTKIINPISNPL